MRRTAGIRLLMAAWMMAAWSLRAQEPAYWTLTDADGLSGNQVYDILQDRKGYMWIATNGGISRYDGRVFTSFEHPSQLSKGMTSLAEDTLGRIWMHNFSGQVYFIDDGRLHPFPEQPSAAPKGITTAYLIEGRLLQISTSDSLYVYRLSGELKARRALQDLYAEASGLPRPGPGKSWSALPSGSYLYLFYQTTEFRSIRLDTDLRIQHSTVLPGYPRPLNGLLLLHSAGNRGTAGPVYSSLEAQGKPFAYIDYEQYRIRNLTSDTQGWHWICTDRGVQGYRPDGSLVFGGGWYMQDQSISVVRRDRTGRYWIGTLWNGVRVIPDLNTLVYTPATSPLADQRITQVEADGQGQIWIGTVAGGPQLLTPDGRWLSPPFTTRSEITALYYDAPRDSVWSSSSPGRWSKHAVVLYSARTLGSPEPAFSLGSLKQVVRAGGWAYAASNFASTARRMRGTAPMPWQHCFPDFKPDSQTFMIRSRAWAVLPDTSSRTQRLWLAHAEALWVCDGQNLTAIRDPASGRDIAARDLDPGRNGMIWAGTTSQGVYGFRDGQAVVHLDEADGLPDNSAYQIETDGDTLFIATRKGIVRWIYPSGEFRIYDRSRGLINYDVTSIQLDARWLWIGTSAGLQRVSRQVFSRALPDIPVYLTGAAIWERDTALLPAYALAHDQNNLRFDFTGVDFSSQPAFHYRYRLLGLDSAWIPIPASQQSVRFPSLGPGSYTFEVRAVYAENPDGGQTARVQIRIARPWWTTWWFRAGMAVLVAALAAGLTALRIRQTQQQRRIGQQLTALKMHALQSQMNPHFIFNALNAIQHFLTQHQTEPALLYLSRFAQLIRFIFDHSRRERVSLEEELSFLRVYALLEQLRFGDRIEVQIEVPPELDGESVMIPPLLLQPLLENAFKHGLWHKQAPGTLRLQIEQAGQFLHASVTDDGIGREAAREIGQWRSKPHRSAGLSTISERLQLFNQQLLPRKPAVPEQYFVVTDLYDAKGAPAGTRVELWIALG